MTAREAVSARKRFRQASERINEFQLSNLLGAGRESVQSIKIDQATKST